MDLQGKVTIKEAAKQTNYKEYTLRRYAREEVIPAEKIGRDWLILVADVENYRAQKPQRVPFAEQSNRQPRAEAGRRREGKLSGG